MQKKFSQIILAIIFWQLTVFVIFCPGLYFLLVCKSGAAGWHIAPENENEAP